ncbi:MAG: arsenic efflux protein [Pseudobacteriovorax sp.]|nr:arsenic efflux protein [Pseudobacteriovorax sp.]
MDFLSFTLDNLEASGVIGGYVAISIIGFALIGFALKDKMQNMARLGPKWAQPIIGAIFGIIPGCGGTIVVSTMYKNGQVSFGALLAAFTATLGEGSFVLLGASDESSVAGNLTAFFIVNIIGFVLGIILGYGADLLGFRVDIEAMSKHGSHESHHHSESTFARKFIDDAGFYSIIAMALFLAPGSIMALWGGGIDYIAELTVWVATALTLTSIVYFGVNKFVLKGACSAKDHNNIKAIMLDAVADISMVVAYVFMGLFIANGIIDIAIGPERFDVWMASSAFSVVLIAALLGVLTGCGGMIAVAAAYVTVPNFPIAALIAASIATSGDGIFPLLAQNKKDAIMVSLAGFVSAIVVGYFA